MAPGSIAESIRSILSGSTETGSRAEARGLGALEDADSAASSSDSEVDAESLFIYSRVPQLPGTFFRSDAISACLISAEFHAYGTHNGILHLARPDMSSLRTTRVHRSSILDISSSKGAFVGTASIDGTVNVQSVEDRTDFVQASFRRPVHAIALHPDYKAFRSYVSGGTAGQVVLSERGWLKSRSDTVLADTSSTILALLWATPSRLFWCNEDGITAYNPEARNVLQRTPRPPHSPRADLFRPRMVLHEKHLVVAWHRVVYVLSVESGALVSSVGCAATLAGALPFHGLQQFVVLSVDKEPELKVITAHNGQEIYADELELRGAPKLGVNDYYLAQGDASRLWIVSSGDAVVARERKARDHVDWLVEHDKFYDAFAAAKQPEAEVGAAERNELGSKAATQLVGEGRWELAAHVLAETLGDDRAGWLIWSNPFLNAGEHLTWGDVLPPIELGGVQDSILEAALARRDLARLQHWVDAWPLDVFDGPGLAAKLQAAAAGTSTGTGTGAGASTGAGTGSSTGAGTSAGAGAGADTALHEVLARLWLRLDEYVKSVHEFVLANSSRAFDVASHYHLWTEPEVEHILGAVLSSGNGEDGTGGYVDRLRELIRCRAEITPSRVVHQLEREAPDGSDSPDEVGQDLLLFGYLTELGLVDETWLGEFADLMVRLYAKYDPDKLLGFLERFDTYDIAASIRLCRDANLDRELVYLLGCVGKSQESLDIMIKKLGDYEHAIAFARTQGPDAWEYLIEYCSQHPGLVLELLKCVEVSPARVLAMVPESMHINGLKQALCKVLNNQEVSLELNSGALDIVRAEAMQWARKLEALRLEGAQVSDLDSVDWSEPQLLGSARLEKAESSGPVLSYSGKIRHLKWLLGI